MSKTLTILDKDYKNWIKELSSRYKKSQLKAAVKVNSEMLHFYYDLGKDIVAMKAEQKWGSGFMKNLSRDLKEQDPGATCFSETNLLYMKNFYLLYHSFIEITPQVGEQIEGNEITPQVGEQLDEREFSQQDAEKIETTFDGDTVWLSLDRWQRGDRAWSEHWRKYSNRSRERRDKGYSG